MGFKELPYLDEKSYLQEMQKFAKGKEYLELQTREVTKIRQIYAAWTKISVGGILSIPTVGLSLIGSTLGARQLVIASKKLLMVREVMTDHDVPFHVEQLRDKVIPIAVTIIAAAVSLGIGVGMEELFQAQLAEAAAQGVTPAAHAGVDATANSAASNPDVFGQGFLHGVQTQVDQLMAVFMPGNTVTNAAMENVQNAVPAGTGADYMNGGNLGATMALGAEKGLGALGVQQGLQHGLDFVMAKQTREEVKKRAKKEGLAFKKKFGF